MSVLARVQGYRMLPKRLQDNLRTAPRPYWLLKLFLLPFHQSTLSLEICAPHVGFFAQLSWCLQIAYFCEEHGLIPLLSAVSPQYRDPGRARNWLTHFFDMEPVKKPDFVIRDLRQLHLGSRSAVPTIERGAALRAKYLPVKRRLRKRWNHLSPQTWPGGMCSVFTSEELIKRRRPPGSIGKSLYRP